MTAPEQHSAALLGWTGTSWDASDGEPLQAFWDDFTQEQVAAAELMGFTSKNFREREPEREPAAEGVPPRSDARSPEGVPPADWRARSDSYAPGSDSSHESELEPEPEPEPEPVAKKKKKKKGKKKKKKKREPVRAQATPPPV